jgi:hypothetical protein
MTDAISETKDKAHDLLKFLESFLQGKVHPSGNPAPGNPGNPGAAAPGSGSHERAADAATHATSAPTVVHQSATPQMNGGETHALPEPRADADQAATVQTAEQSALGVDPDSITPADLHAAIAALAAEQPGLAAALVQAEQSGGGLAGVLTALDSIPVDQLDAMVDLPPLSDPQVTPTVPDLGSLLPDLDGLLPGQPDLDPDLIKVGTDTADNLGEGNYQQAATDMANQAGIDPELTRTGNDLAEGNYQQAATDMANQAGIDPELTKTGNDLAEGNYQQAATDIANQAGIDPELTRTGNDLADGDYAAAGSDAARLAGDDQLGDGIDAYRDAEKGDYAGAAWNAAGAAGLQDEAENLVNEASDAGLQALDDSGILKGAAGSLDGLGLGGLARQGAAYLSENGLEKSYEDGTNYVEHEGVDKAAEGLGISSEALGAGRKILDGDVDGLASDALHAGEKEGAEYLATSVGLDDNLGDGLVDLTDGDVGEGIKNIGVGAAETAASVIPGVSAVIDVGEELLDGDGDMGTTIVREVIAGGLTAAGAAVGGPVGAVLGHFAGEFVGGMVAPLVMDAVDELGDIVDGAGEVVGDIVHGAGEVVDDVVDGAGEVVDDVVDGLGDAASDVGDALSDAWDSVF